MGGAAGPGARSAHRPPVPPQERPPRAAWVARPAARAAELAPGTAIKLALTCTLDVKVCTLLNRMVLELSSLLSAALVGRTTELACRKVLSLRRRHTSESFISIRPCPVTMRTSSESSPRALSDAQVHATRHGLRGHLDFWRLRCCPRISARDRCCAARSWRACVCPVTKSKGGAPLVRSEGSLFACHPVKIFTFISHDPGVRPRYRSLITWRRTV